MTLWSARRQFGHRSERGQITAMLVIFALTLLLAISAVIDVSASYLQRQSVTSLADGAALAALDAAAAAGVYGSPTDEFVPIDQTAAAAAVEMYLQSTDAYGDYPGLGAVVVVHSHTVVVSLSMPYELPVSIPGVQDATTIHASGAAVLPIY